MESKKFDYKKREDAVTLPGANEYRENIRHHNEKLGEVLNELVTNEELNDPYTIQWMATYVAEVRMFLAMLASDMVPNQTISNGRNC